MQTLTRDQIREHFPDVSRRKDEEGNSFVVADCPVGDGCLALFTVEQEEQEDEWGQLMQATYSVACVADINPHDINTWLANKLPPKRGRHGATKVATAEEQEEAAQLSEVYRRQSEARIPKKDLGQVQQVQQVEKVQAVLEPIEPDTSPEQEQDAEFVWQKPDKIALRVIDACESLNDNAKQVWKQLFLKANDDQRGFFSSLNMIAEAVCKSRSSVDRAVKQLRDRGWLLSQRRQRTSYWFPIVPGNLPDGTLHDDVLTAAAKIDEEYVPVVTLFQNGYGEFKIGPVN